MLVPQQRIETNASEILKIYSSLTLASMHQVPLQQREAADFFLVHAGHCRRHCRYHCRPHHRSRAGNRWLDFQARLFGAAKLYPIHINHEPAAGWAQYSLFAGLSNACEVIVAYSAALAIVKSI